MYSQCIPLQGRGFDESNQCAHIGAGRCICRRRFAGGFSCCSYQGRISRHEGSHQCRLQGGQSEVRRLSGQPKNLCVAEAKARKNAPRQSAEADYENTPKAREKAVIADAEATYMVAKEQCATKTGNDKDVCVKAAKAAETKAKADAKAARKTTVAKTDAKDTKRDADYKVAREKCDPLTGAAKDKCVADAKAKYAQ